MNYGYITNLFFNFGRNGSTNYERNQIRKSSTEEKYFFYRKIYIIF